MSGIRAQGPVEAASSGRWERRIQETPERETDERKNKVTHPKIKALRVPEGGEGRRRGASGGGKKLINFLNTRARTSQLLKGQEGTGKKKTLEQEKTPRLSG